jgi:hypothetical protein
MPYFLPMIALLFLPFFLFGCAAEKQFHLPELANIHDGCDEHAVQACMDVFPQGNWQFVHSIDFSMRDGSGTTLVGVTTLTENTISSALVTVEGLTLFAADFHQDNSFKVRRAVPPFNTDEFALGMMGDIRAIFQPPPGKSLQQGQLAGTTSVCRYVDANGGVVDILPTVKDCWQIKSYTPALIMNRSIDAKSCRKFESISIPDYLLLKTYGQAGYTLKMKLISANKN